VKTFVLDKFIDAMAKKALMSSCDPALTQEDFYQEAQLMILQCAPAFDSKRSSERTYMANNAKWRFQKILRSQRLSKNKRRQSPLTTFTKTIKHDDFSVRVSNAMASECVSDDAKRILNFILKHPRFIKRCSKACLRDTLDMTEWRFRKACAELSRF
jgi:hypothetical protein